MTELEAERAALEREIALFDAHEPPPFMQSAIADRRAKIRVRLAEIETETRRRR